MSEMIQLISGPRNISTALMYSFGNRKDTAIIDEPFYAYYLEHTGVDHPGREETLKTQSSDPSEVIKVTLQKQQKEKYLFVKNMAHHMINFDLSYTYKVRNIFLIRDPRQLINSFAKVIAKPNVTDIGLKREYAIYQEVQEHANQPYAVIDTGEVLKDPEKVLRLLCERIQIPFDEAMLAWPAGPRKEDGVWASYWYNRVHQSTHFEPQPTNSRSLPEHLMPLYLEVLPYYKKLFDHAIKA